MKRAGISLEETRCLMLIPLRKVTRNYFFRRWIHFHRMMLSINIAFAVLSRIISAQDILLKNYLFQSVDEPSSYKYYSNNFVLFLWEYVDNPEKGISIDTLSYGFYNSCALPSIDSLKRRGIFYFEVEPSDFNDESRKQIAIQNCNQLNVLISNKDTVMTIFNSSRQQHATYKKIKTLPQNVLDHLRKRGVKLNVK